GPDAGVVGRAVQNGRGDLEPRGRRVRAEVKTQADRDPRRAEVSERRAVDRSRLIIQVPGHCVQGQVEIVLAAQRTLALGLVAGVDQQVTQLVFLHASDPTQALLYFGREALW